MTGRWPRTTSAPSSPIRGGAPKGRPVRSSWSRPRAPSTAPSRSARGRRYPRDWAMTREQPRHRPRGSGTPSRRRVWQSPAGAGRRSLPERAPGLHQRGVPPGLVDDRGQPRKHPQRDRPPSASGGNGRHRSLARDLVTPAAQGGVTVRSAESHRGTMGRSNVIIVGSVVLAPLILGLESYALFRAHHRRARTAEITGLTEMNAAPVLGAPVARAPAIPLSAERPSPPPPPAPAAPTAEDPPPPKPRPSVTSRRTRRSSSRQPADAASVDGEVLQAADEQVFDLLQSAGRTARRDPRHRRRLRAHRPGDCTAPAGRRPSERGAGPERRSGATRGDRRRPRPGGHARLHFPGAESRASRAQSIPPRAGARPLDVFSL